ncbi:hypothetical protein PWT90_01490 [Aphanocladium album]|nr:hypothetical protein PWT90_01490 [Aphanocladium album]
MMAILCALVTLLLSLASASPFALRAASSNSDSDPDRTYVEVLYPRNETYRLDAPLPIVLAVSNLPPTESLGNFSLHWAVATYGNDDEPGDLLGVQGSMYPRNQTADKSEPVVMADFVDLLYEFNHVSHYVPDRLELLLALRYERGKDADACLGENQGLPANRPADGDGVSRRGRGRAGDDDDGLGQAADDDGDDAGRDDVHASAGDADVDAEIRLPVHGRRQHGEQHQQQRVGADDAAADGDASDVFVVEPRGGGDADSDGWNGGGGDCWRHDVAI